MNGKKGRQVFCGRTAEIPPQKRKNSAGAYEKHSSEFFLEVRSRVELLYTVLQTAT